MKTQNHLLFGVFFFPKVQKVEGEKWFTNWKDRKLKDLKIERF